MSTTVEQARLDALEKRLNDTDKKFEKYDTIIDNLSKIVTEMEASSKVNARWITALLSIFGAVGGVLLGHFIR